MCPTRSGGFGSRPHTAGAGDGIGRLRIAVSEEKPAERVIRGLDIQAGSWHNVEYGRYVKSLGEPRDGLVLLPDHP